MRGVNVAEKSNSVPGIGGFFGAVSGVKRDGGARCVVVCRLE